MTQKFDATAMFARLQQTKEDHSNNQGGGKKYPYRLIFIKPMDGAATLNVRLLYNNTSNAVTFSYYIHQMQDKSKLYCGKNNQNNPSCEFCDALKNRYNLTKVASKEENTGRAILLAQYISSTGYEFDKNHPAPVPGEIIIVQGPQSLHLQVVDSMLKLGANALPSLLLNVVGNVVTIGRDSQGKQVVVTPTFDQVTSAASQQDFENLWKALPSLESIAFFDGPTEEDYRRLHEAAEAVNRSMSTPVAPQNYAPQSYDQYINQAQPMAPQFGQPQPQNFGQPIQQPQVQQQPAAPAKPGVSGFSMGIQPAPQPMAVNPVLQGTPAPVLPVTPIAVVQPAAPIVSDPLPASFGQPSVGNPYYVAPTAPVTLQTYPSPAMAQAVPNVGEPTLTVKSPKGTFSIAGLEDAISQRCVKVYDPNSEVCQMCLAEKFCPYKDDLPF